MQLTKNFLAGVRCGLPSIYAIGSMKRNIISGLKERIPDYRVDFADESNEQQFNHTFYARMGDEDAPRRFGVKIIRREGRLSYAIGTAIGFAVLPAASYAVTVLGVPWVWFAGTAVGSNFVSPALRGFDFYKEYREGFE